MTWEFPTSFGWPVAYPEDFDPEQETSNALRATVAEVLGEEPARPVEMLVEQGHAGPTLVAAARDTDLLVVGSRGHGEFVGMLIGSVSEYCVTNAQSPVLVHRAVA